MRQIFFENLYNLMMKNHDVYFVTGDLGYHLADKIRDTFHKRFYNVGAAEQAMMGVGIGLALQGKIPFVYSITPFLLFRPFEAIRTYLSHEGIPVIMVGSGRDWDYSHDGFSHYGGDDKIVLQLPGIEYRDDIDLDEIVKSKKPTYLSLAR